MHSKSDSIEIMINDEAVEVINESMKDSELVFHYVHILHYKLQIYCVIKQIPMVVDHI